MKKRLSDNKIFIRFISLFFFIPFGIIVIARSKKQKHKILFGIIYFCLYVLFGFPIAFIFLGRSDLLNQYSEMAMFYLVPFSISLIIYVALITKDFLTSRKYKSTNVIPKEINQTQNEKETNYQKQNLLTNNELNFYKDLLLIADKYGFNVLSKVRLADLIKVDPSLSNKEWWSNFGKIKSKHVDFVLARRSDLSVVLVIELDDFSHTRYDRMERDAFVDKVFKDVGIPILRVYNSNNLEKEILNKIKNYKEI